MPRAGFNLYGLSSIANKTLQDEWPNSMGNWIEEGASAPAFELPSDGGRSVTLTDLQGTPVVLFFYPRDDTPG